MRTLAARTCIKKLHKLPKCKCFIRTLNIIRKKLKTFQEHFGKSTLPDCLAEFSVCRPAKFLSEEKALGM